MFFFVKITQSWCACVCRCSSRTQTLCWCTTWMYRQWTTAGSHVVLSSAPSTQTGRSGPSGARRSWLVSWNPCVSYLYFSLSLSSSLSLGAFSPTWEFESPWDQCGNKSPQASLQGGHSRVGLITLYHKIPLATFSLFFFLFPEVDYILFFLQVHNWYTCRSAAEDRFFLNKKWFIYYFTPVLLSRAFQQDNFFVCACMLVSVSRIFHEPLEEFD